MSFQLGLGVNSDFTHRTVELLFFRALFALLGFFFSQFGEVSLAREGIWLVHVNSWIGDRARILRGAFVGRQLKKLQGRGDVSGERQGCVRRGLGGGSGCKQGPLGVL